MIAALAVVGGCGRSPTVAPAVATANATSIHWTVLPSSVEVRDVPAAIADRLHKSGVDVPLGRDVLKVSVEGGDGTPMMGTYALKFHTSGSKILVFFPRFPFAPEVSYRAAFDSGQLMPNATIRVEQQFSLPKMQSDVPAEVARVYPTSDRLPENLLRFYVHFATPMRRGEAYEHIKLLDDKGVAVVSPFLAVSEELWDPSGQRLTLFIDPGRIKRGLKPREDMGPVLEAGKNYTLAVDSQWRDANGTPLAKEYKKSFRVEAPTEKGIDPEQWKIESPRSASKDALKIQFPLPLDYAILHRAVTVFDAKGQPIAGLISVADGETRWQFVPEAEWSVGRYAIRIERFLEDVAGNRVGRPFEVDEDTRPVNADGLPVERTFDVR